MKKITTSELLFFALLVLVIFIPLYPKLPLASITGTYVAIRLEDIFILGLFLGWCTYYFKHYKRLLSQNVIQSFLLFWLIGFLGVVSGFLVTHTVGLNLGFFHFLRRIEVMTLFFVSATLVHNLKQVKAILLSLLVVTFLVVIYGFGQIYFSFPVISTTNREFSKGLILTLTPGARPNSTFAGHYDLAAFLSVVIIFIGTLFFESKLKPAKDLFKKAVYVVSGIGSVVLLSLTAARISFLAALVGLVVSFWLMGRKILIIGLVICSLLALVISPQLRHRLVATITVNLLEGGGPKYQPSPNATNAFTPKDPNFKEDEATADASLQEATESATPSASVIAADIAPGEPIDTTELGVYRSFNIRLNVEWPRAIRALEKNPIIGTGYSSLTIATDNDILRSLGETGIFGTASLLLIFFIILKRFFWSLKILKGFEKLFIISSICMVVCILVTGTFIDILEASKIATLFWIMLGVGWAVSRQYKDRK